MAIYSSIKNGYEAVAESFSQTRQNFWQDLSFIKKYVKEKDRVLDFGCGNGRLLGLIKDKKINYLGVDICHNFIKIARLKYPTYKFKTLKLNSQFDFAKNKKFDVIFCLSVFHHFPKGEKREMILQKFNKILKPNGILIMTVWDLHQNKYEKYFQNGKSGRIPFKNSLGQIIFNRYCYRWELKELENFIAAANFKIINSGETKRDGRPANLYCIAQK